jgi:branched-chain amino acid transport system ATP-binding protein
MTPLLEVRNLRAGYGGQEVVHDLSLTVDPGQIVVLLGANGAGKTTTMLTIAGALPAMGGTVMFDGSPLTGPIHRRARLGIGFLSEERSVFMGLTALANLQLGRGPIDAAVALFPQLGPLLDRRAGDLSGGEQQMLTLARALAAEPKLLLVDELSLGLAPIVVLRLLEAIKAAASRGMAVLMVEQHAHKALGVADFAYVLRRGVVSLNGSAAGLRKRFDQVERSYLVGDLDDVTA